MKWRLVPVVWSVVALASADAAPALDQRPWPEGDPIRTVIAMFAAFEQRDPAGWVAAMSRDYRFDSDDASFARSHPLGFSREDESAFATHLFLGGGRAPDGSALPIATRVDAPLGAVWVEMREIGSTHAIAHVERYAYQITLDDGSRMMLMGSDNVLELEREDGEWRVLAWHERTADHGALTSSPDSASDLPKTAVATPAQEGALPERLAIRRLGALRGSIVLELALPGSGGALELFDVAGRRMARRDLDGVRAGVRRVELPAHGVPAGTYWARVQQAGSVATTRVILLE